MPHAHVSQADPRRAACGRAPLPQASLLVRFSADAPAARRSLLGHLGRLAPRLRCDGVSVVVCDDSGAESLVAIAVVRRSMAADPCRLPGSVRALVSAAGDAFSGVTALDVDAPRPRRRSLRRR